MTNPIQPIHKLANTMTRYTALVFAIIGATLLAFVWLFLAALNSLIKRDWEPLNHWRIHCYRRMQRIQVSRVLETNLMAEIIEARDRWLNSTNKTQGLNWDNNQGIQYYAECVKVIGGEMEKTPDDKFVLRNFRIYAKKKDFHEMRGVTGRNLEGIINSLLKQHLLVQAIYVRIGEGDYIKYTQA